MPTVWQLRAAGAMWACGRIPKPKDAGAPRGVVLEVAVPAGIEVLAAWLDGRAAYAGADGLVAEGDAGSETDERTRHLVSIAHDLRTSFPAPRRDRRPRVLSVGRVRFSLLTPAGIRRREEDMPRGGAIAAGAGETFDLLMEAQELMLTLRGAVASTPAARVS